MPRHPRRPARLLVILVAAANAVTLTACSGSSGTSSGSADGSVAPPAGTGAATSPPPAPSAVSSAPSSASPPSAASSASALASSAPDVPSKAQLTALLLTRADLPAGWTQAPADAVDPAQDRTQQAAFAKCMGIRDTYPDQVAEVDSPNFNQGQASVSATATSYTTPEAVKSDAAAFAQGAKVGACMKKMLEPTIASQLPAGARVDGFDITVTPGASGGPSNVVAALSAVLTVSVSGQQVAAHVDSYYIAGTQVEANVVFQNIGSSVPAALRASAVKKVADRVAAG